jgi:hypothetical protein
MHKTAMFTLRVFPSGNKKSAPFCRFASSSGANTAAIEAAIRDALKS